MGGCCCSSRKPHLHGTPVYYYCPPTLEEDSLTSRNGSASAFTAGLLVELNLNTSTPDTFRRPPTPLPYDVVLGCRQSTDSESDKENIGGSTLETSAACGNIEEADCKTQVSPLLVSPKKPEMPKLSDFLSVTEEEDACPICLEEYDSENPKLVTKCEHHFHVSCILEWMERSDTCPMCDQEMIFDHTLN